MIKITYQHWKELVIHEIIEYKPEEFFASVVQAILSRGSEYNIPQLNWVDGVILSISPFPDTPEIIEDKLKGIIHYAAVEFALYPNYKPEVIVEKSGSRHIKLKKFENNPIFTQLAKFLKEGSYKKEE
ncbi:MAG: hypothetical protein ABSB40_07015 [Nitrososphaeria archaeon]|jgi:hypothetical protein